MQEKMSSLSPQCCAETVMQEVPWREAVAVDVVVVCVIVVQCFRFIEGLVDNAKVRLFSGPTKKRN